MAKATKAKVNLFDRAKANPVKSNAVEQGPVEVLTPGLEHYAMADALYKQVNTLKETLRIGLADKMMNQFIVNKSKGKPLNYKALELKSSASMECRKRASNSGLKPDELALLEKNNISTTFIEGDFVLNVQGVSMEKLQEVSDAISRVEGLPENFIKFDESKARTIVTDTSIEEVFRINDVETVKELLKVVAVFGIKPKTSASLKKIIETVSHLLEDEDD